MKNVKHSFIQTFWVLAPTLKYNHCFAGPDVTVIHKLSSTAHAPLNGSCWQTFLLNTATLCLPSGQAYLEKFFKK